MKKLIISLVVLVIMNAVYAEDDGNLFKISMLLDTNRLSDAALYEISSLASSLDSTEKMLLLSQHEKGAWGPLLQILFRDWESVPFFRGIIPVER